MDTAPANLNSLCQTGQDVNIGRELSVEIVGRMHSAQIIAHTQASYDPDNMILKG